MTDQTTPDDGSDLDPMSAQIAGVWGNLMSAMTAQGATRDQIADVALQTAGAILSLTANALWQDGEAPESEADRAFRVQQAVGWCFRGA